MYIYWHKLEYYLLCVNIWENLFSVDREALDCNCAVPNDDSLAALFFCFLLWDMVG